MLSSAPCAERAFQTDKGRLSAALSDWRGVCAMFHKYHGIEKTAVGYRLAAMTTSLKSFGSSGRWSRAPPSSSPSASAFRRGARAATPSARSLCTANYVRFVAAAQRAEPSSSAPLALGDGRYAQMRMKLEDMLGTNERRNCKRSLRWWRDFTAARARLSLRERYLTSRTTYYARRNLLDGWRMHATARARTRGSSRCAPACAS